jgi:Tfp pilus assembly protein PilP
MSRLRWQSPWPQWRTHWHLWHAWPLLGQALLLFTIGVVASGLISWYWSSSHWQAWLSAQETQDDILQSLRQLQAQHDAYETTRTKLLSMKHPSGKPIPAWQSMTATDLEEDLSTMQQLAKQHGLQLQAVNDQGGHWRGPLSHVLAAWQSLSYHMPHYRLKSFTLRRLAQKSSTTKATIDIVAHASSKTARTVGVEMQWEWTTSLEPQTRHKPVALNPMNAASPHREASDSPRQVLHNPFAVDGLVQALPTALSHAHPFSRLHGKSLDQLQWVGMLANTQHTYALVRDSEFIHAVQLGEAMGPDWGIVQKINADHLLLREWHVNEQGLWQIQTKRFPLSVAP